MARLLRRSRLLLALLQLAVVLWLAATSGCLCRQLTGGVPSSWIHPDGNQIPRTPPSPLPAGYHSQFVPPPVCPPDCL
uniref:Uncharacterized protein n=1 Tax=Leersia perrieri TaxID=77586 RepID=A0A0D9VDN5_9ORYZ